MSKFGLAVVGVALWCLFMLVGSPAFAMCPNPPPPPTSCVNANGCYGKTVCDDYPKCGSFTGVSNVSCTVCGVQGHVRCDSEGELIAGTCSAYGPEKCDACDNDGDSLIDEGTDGAPLTGGSCDPLANGCTGTRTCSAGQFQCVIPSGTRRQCDESRYGCENATAACQPDGTHGPCQPAVTTQEKCNGCDDNKDGVVDNLPGQGTGTLTQACRTSGGTCADSVQTCVVQDTGSAWGQCVAPAEACNGLDDDCDGSIDEGDVCALYCMCSPTTCAAQGKNCGSISDGCGGTLNCGTCGSGQACTNNVCSCQPTTCAAQGKNCGSIPDSCGGTLNCGTCGSGQACTNNVCSCQPTTCAAQGKNCGSIPDGCGGTLNCGTCGSGQACTNNVCSCQPTTCAAQGKTCGVIANGCGGSLNCGVCGEGEDCINNQCICQPKTCAELGATCGRIFNGCNGWLNCGACPEGQACGAMNTCVPSVTCPTGQYLCCDGQTCSDSKYCPEVACSPGGGGVDS